MIIRNPYGFIAKHFKLINLLLLVPLFYITLAMSDIGGFFRDYVAAGYSTPETNFTESYVSALLVGVSVFMLAVNVIFYLIFTSRKKNGWLYLGGAIYFVIILFALFFFYTIMGQIEMGRIEATFANFVRDFAGIVILPIYFFIVATFIKGIGFNIKTFRLDNNADLKLTEDDEDEIELSLGSDNNALKRNVVHVGRELKYYILENKFVFTCVMVLFFGIIGFTAYKTFRINNRTYSVHQAFTMEGFEISVKDSYITNTDFRGTKISDDKYYLAVKIGIFNRKAEAKVDRANFRIYVDDQVLYPTYDKSARFADIGKEYKGDIIAEDGGADYVFVYELTEDQIKYSYQLKILNGLSTENGKLIKKYKNVNIRPQNILKTVNLGEYKMKRMISLNDTTLGKTKFTLSSFDVVPSYPYTYEVCNTEFVCKEHNGVQKCQNEKVCIDNTTMLVPSGGKALLIIDDVIMWDETSPYFNLKDKDFYGDFVTIKYTYYTTGHSSDKMESRAVLKNITPQIIEDKYVYEVPRNLLRAEKIDLVLKIRNKKFTINVK